MAIRPDVPGVVLDPRRRPVAAGPNAPGTPAPAARPAGPAGPNAPGTSPAPAAAPTAAPTPTPAAAPSPAATSAAPAPASTPAAAPAAPGAGPAASSLVNTAPMNQGLQDLANDYKDRITQSRGTENTADARLTGLYDQYQNRLSADTTKRAIGRATLANADMATGQKQAYQEAMAARGTSGTGAGADVSGRFEEAGRRRSSNAAADISLGREGQLDALTLGGLGIAGAQANLNLARAGQTNSLYGGAANAYGAAGAANLAERGFNLQQYQTQAQVDLARQQEERMRQAQQEQAWRNALTAMPSSGVYAPFPGGGGGGYSPGISADDQYRAGSRGYGIGPGF